MKKLIFVPLLLSYVLRAQEPDSTSAIFSLREAERSFAKTSVMLGRQAAFTQFFNDESFLFTGNWITNGKEFWKGGKPSPSVLKWEPEFMMISGSKDFGISTGPWESQEYRPYTKATGTGYFLTVWKKQADGVWKVFLDAGISTPVKTSNLHSFRFLPEVIKSDSKLQITDYQILVGLDNQILTHMKGPAPTAEYLKYHDDHSIVLCKGHLPSESRDSVKQWISKLKKDITWKTFSGGIASSGDLGFTCGNISDSGSYVRIWRKNDRNEWKIIIELLNP